MGVSDDILRTRLAELVERKPWLHRDIVPLIGPIEGSSGRAGLSTSDLETLLGEVIQDRGGDPRDAQTTPEIHRQERQYTAALSKSLAAWMQINPPQDEAGVSELLKGDGPLVLFRVLNGRAPVRDLESAWSRYYDPAQVRLLVQFLQKALQGTHKALYEALEAAA